MLILQFPTYTNMLLTATSSVAFIPFAFNFFQDGLYLWAAKFFPLPVLFLVSHLSMTLFFSLSSLVLTYKLLVVSSGLSRVPQSTSRGLVLVQERSGFSIVIWEGAWRMFIKQ